ncbi:TrbG/VirB9 family P-type conjugative transfer protein [Anaplasmataceae bacterium AB001_6]|nr:TrbG/VirB9 family P-type conjugative transfer protein [Anaplasmataceae bacterium AB001_6]
MKCYLKLILLITTLFFNISLAYSEIPVNQKGTNMISLAVRNVPRNVHIKHVLYKENTLYEYIGYYGVATIINFDKNEEIVNLIMGDTTAWQFHNLGNKLLLKPIGEPEIATTNAIIYTNKNRTYHIMMQAEEPNNIYDRSIPFEIKFIYNDNDTLDVKRISDMNSKLYKVNIADFEYINFEYTVSGNNLIKPLRVFDDRQFTYFKFYDINGDIPAIFSVDDDGYEALINFKIQDDYIVVDRVVSRFTLRHGTKHACVFNEAMPYSYIRERDDEATNIQ